MYKIKASPGRTVTIHKKEFLYFSGTAYLGMPRNPDFRRLVIEGFDRYGTNFGGSRLANVRFDIFDETERTLIDLTGAPAAISVSSGTAAGQLLAHYFFDKAVMLATPDAHPSMIAPGQEVRRLGHNWTLEIPRILEAIHEPVVLFCNAVNVLHVQKTDFSWLAQVPFGKNFTLVVDDSHYLGIGGVRGGGTFSELKCPDHVELVVVSSLGKAFGVPAGIILGTEALIDGLWRTPLFGGGSPTVLAYLHAFVKGQQIYEKNRAILKSNIAKFLRSLPESNRLQTFEGYPVFSVKDENLADELFEQGIILSSFPYPSPTSPKVTRIVLNSLHRNEDIDTLLSHL
jgi:8-amino-7-oxononanoate synthase